MHFSEKIKTRLSSTLTLTALIVASAFALSAFVLLKSTLDNIDFIERERLGVADHQMLMSIHIALHHKNSDSQQLWEENQHIIRKLSDRYGGLGDEKLKLENLHDINFELMQQVADRSNLILDPKLSSYYLMNIAIKIIPEMVTVLDEHIGDQQYQKAILQNFLRQIKRSLKVIELEKLDARLLNQHTEELEKTINKDQTELFLAQLGEIYQATSIMLDHDLEKRLSHEKRHLAISLIVMTILGVIATIFSVLTIRYFLRKQEFQSAQERLALLEKLEQTNKELETLSYFTAHDLKEPVRTIACYTTMVMDSERGALLSPKEKEWLGISKNAAMRVSDMLNSILTYLETGHFSSQPVTKKQYDAEQLLHEVMQDLSAAINEANATISCHDLPELNVDELLLKRVFQNIIANGIKYRSRERTPEISVMAQERDNEWLFLIQDNGLGFNMQYAADIFEPFKRLHDETDNKGSGIGLSICKKAVNKMGGRIWVESEPNMGTKVFFTIPK